MRSRFVQGAEDGDETVVVDGIRVFIAKAIIEEYGEVEVDVSQEHDQLIVRSLGSDV